MVPSTLSAETQGGSQATHANLSLEMKGQLLDIVQLQSNMQIFTAKYPKANVVCGIQVDGSSDLQWQCYGPDASKQEIHRALVDFINEEYRYQKQLSAGALDAALYTLPKNFAKFNILRNFIDAAAMAGIVAGVQVTMLLDLATKLCDTGADGGSTPPAPPQMPAVAGAAGSLPGAQVVTSKGQLQPLPPQQQPRTTQQQHHQQHHQEQEAYPEASSLISMDSMDTARDMLSAGMAMGVGSRSGGGRKPRFTKEQQASIMESVERNFRLHPSRYTDLVIREMKELYPSLPLTAACVRKIKFRATEAQKAAESQGAAPDLQLEQQEQLEQSPAPATSSAPVAAPPRRSRQQLQQQQQRRRQQQAADEEGMEEEGAVAGTTHRMGAFHAAAQQAPAYAEQEMGYAEHDMQQQQQQQLYERQLRPGSHPPQQQQQEEDYEDGGPSHNEDEQAHEQQQQQQHAGESSALLAPGNMLLAAAAAASAGMTLPPYGLGTSGGPVQLPEAPRLQVLPLSSMQQMVDSGLPGQVVQQAQAQLMMRGQAAAAAAAGGTGPGYMGPVPGDRLLQCLEAAERLGGGSEPSQLKRPRSDAYEASMGISSYTNGSQSAAAGGGGGSGSLPVSKRQRMTPEQMAALMDSVRHHIAVNPERYTQLVMRDMKEKYPELELNMGQIRKIKFRSMGNNNSTARANSGSHQGTPAPGYAATSAAGCSSSMSHPGMADPTQALLAAAAAGGGPANLALSAAGIGQLADVLSGLQGGAGGGGAGGISLPAMSAALALQLGAAAGAAAGQQQQQQQQVPLPGHGDVMMVPAAEAPLAMLQQRLQGGGQHS